jgi:hypothetical protein
MVENQLPLCDSLNEKSQGNKGQSFFLSKKKKERGLKRKGSQTTTKDKPGIPADSLAVIIKGKVNSPHKS